MQAVISCQKLIDRPGGEDPLLRLVHLQMNFVPRPVMKNHSGHEDSCPLPGYQCNKRSNWNSLDRRLAHSQPYLLVFTTSDRFIAEYLGVMLVMHKSVTLKYALEGRGTRTEKVPSVHQLPVHLVLDKGHQNARENEPATNLQNKHQISASWAWTLVASEATASSLVERGTMEVMGCPRGARETDGPSSEDSRRPSCREILPPRVRRFSLPLGPAFSITWGPMRVVRCFRESAERGSSSSGFRPAAG